MAKKLWLTILLAVIVTGLGHIYLGFVKRGIIILVVGIAIWIIGELLFPERYGLLGIGGVFWIWQLWDVYKHYKKLNPGQSQITR